MKLIESHLVLVSFLAIMFACGWLVVSGWRHMNDSAYASCLSSLTEAVRLNEPATKLGEKYEDWHTFSEDQVRLVLKDLKAGDCSQYEDVSLDLMGRPIRLALRKTEPNRWPSVIAWSDGRDGTEGTDDDVVMPYGQKIPR